MYSIESTYIYIHITILYTHHIHTNMLLQLVRFSWNPTFKAAMREGQMCEGTGQFRTRGAELRSDG